MVCGEPATPPKCLEADGQEREWVWGQAGLGLTPDSTVSSHETLVGQYSERVIPQTTLWTMVSGQVWLHVPLKQGFVIKYVWEIPG